MANKNRFIATGDNRNPNVQLMPSEAEVYYWDFSREATRRGTSVSSVAWTVDKGNGVSISGESVASSVAQALLTASTNGKAIIKIACTFADASICVKKMVVMIQRTVANDDYGYC